MLLMDLFKYSQSKYLARIFGCAFLTFSACNADAALIELEDFGADAATIEFELPATALPNIPGVTFQEDFGFATRVPGWIASSTTFTRLFFGTAAMGNNMGAGGFSDMAINFSNPVYGVGGWIGHLSSESHLMPEKIAFSIFGVNGLLDEVEVLLPAYGGMPVFVGLGLRRALFVSSGAMETQGFLAWITSFTAL